MNKAIQSKVFLSFGKMITLIWFNMKCFFKKRTMQIVGIFCTIVPLLTLIIFMKARANSGQGPHIVKKIGNIMKFVLTDSGGFPLTIIIFALMMTILISLFIATIFQFNDDSDGLNILVLSRPYSRNRFVASKIISLLLMAIIISFIFLIELLACGFLNDASWAKTINLAFSMFIGFILYGFLVSAIGLITKAIGGKIFSIVFLILLLLITSFVSMILRSEVGADIIRTNKYALNYESGGSSITLYNPNYTKKQQTQSKEKTYLKNFEHDHNSREIPFRLERAKKNAYKKYKNLDFWTQIKHLFFLTDKMSSDYKFSLQEKEILVNNRIKYHREKIFAWEKDSDSNQKPKIKSVILYYRDLIALKKIIKNGWFDELKQFESENNEAVIKLYTDGSQKVKNQGIAIEDIIRVYQSSEFAERIKEKWKMNGHVGSMNYEIKLFARIATMEFINRIANKPNKFKLEKIELEPFKILAVTIKPYSYTPNIIFWLVFSGFLMSIAYLIYFKKDFH